MAEKTYPLPDKDDEGVPCVHFKMHQDVEVVRTDADKFSTELMRTYAEMKILAENVRVNWSALSGSELAGETAFNLTGQRLIAEGYYRPSGKPANPEYADRIRPVRAEILANEGIPPEE